MHFIETSVTNGTYNLTYYQYPLTVTPGNLATHILGNMFADKRKTPLPSPKRASWRYSSVTKINKRDEDDEENANGPVICFAGKMCSAVGGLLLTALIVVIIVMLVRDVMQENEDSPAEEDP